VRWKLIAVALLSGVVIASDQEAEILRLIEEVKKAPPEEKYKVMNELKLHLRELNRREREEMIRKIYEEFRENREDRHEREEIYEQHEEYEEHREKYEEEFEEKYYEKHEEREIERGEDKSEYIDGKDGHENYDHHYEDED